ncbi:S-acyl fatty acid synthase thioesterase, medium chain [Glossophaga mutica]
MGFRGKKVVNCLYPKPDAIFRLICFPWLGGGSLYFAKWGEKMSDSVEVHSIRLAGRECRSEEPFATDIYQMADEIVCALLPVIQNKPFAFFGHSMGSYIAFMTALRLKEKYNLELMHLFVSSMDAPHHVTAALFPETCVLMPDSSRYAFFVLVSVQAARQAAWPPSVDAEAAIVHSSLATFSRALRRKLPNMKIKEKSLTRSFDAPSKPVLSCDLTCFVGSEDITKDVKAWKDVTSGRFDILTRPGNHFYIKEPANETYIRNYVTKCLELSMLT